jgi:uncharacterized low-complexity protein|tara:strand:+ start:2776 stop:3075 length:300 start_codon:yes stop_codon:yes gene_type:complete
MADKNKISSLGTALVASFTINLTVSPVVNAADNPFEVTSLGSGYMVVDAHEGKCGEGKCGEGKCGDKKDSEGKCGDKKDSEGKCGEGKCGEGKCGSKET